MANYSYKTALEFGLVYIPVTLHTAVKNNDIGFNMLYKKTKERIKYQKSCDNCPAKLKASDIVKGYEYEPDEYVVLSDEDFEKIKKPKDKSISIIEFINLDEVDPIFYDKSYYVQPVGADKAYVTLLKAMQEESKVAIAKTVLGTKEQVVTARVVNGRLMLSTMHFYDEIQADPVKLKYVEVSKTEIALAKNLIKNMTNKFVPENYKNEYRERVLKAIQNKIEGSPINEESPKTRPNNVINLMDALKKSVAQTNKKIKKGGSG